MLERQVVSSRWSVVSEDLPGSSRTAVGPRPWESGTDPKETARVGRMWRMLIMKEFPPALWPFGFGKAGGLGGRSRGRGVAPKFTNASIEPGVMNWPGAANGTVVRRCLNVSNPRMVWGSRSGRASRGLLSSCGHGIVPTELVC